MCCCYVRCITESENWQALPYLCQVDRSTGGDVSMCANWLNVGLVFFSMWLHILLHSLLEMQWLWTVIDSQPSTAELIICVFN